MFIAKRLKSRRKELGYSLAELAVELKRKTNYEVTAQTIDNWERKRNNPTVEGLISLCEFFNQPVSYFFEKKANLTGERKRA